MEEKERNIELKGQVDLLQKQISDKIESLNKI